MEDMRIKTADGSTVVVKQGSSVGQAGRVPFGSGGLATRRMRRLAGYPLGRAQIGNLPHNCMLDRANSQSESSTPNR